MVTKIQDMDEHDFIIKWRLTDKCNYQCSYCLRRKSASDFEITEEEMLQAAEQINNLCKNKKSKVDLIGGEPSLLDLSKICSKLSDAQTIHITTNLSQTVEYYRQVASSCNRLIMTASFHEEYADFDEFFGKIAELSEIKICLEMVSTESNSEIVEKFISKCEENGYTYMVENDLRFEQQNIKQSNKNEYRYKLVFDDGTEKLYKTRNELLTDETTGINFHRKAITPKEMYCTNSYDYVYIDRNIVHGRSNTESRCSVKIPLAKFNLLEKPAKCHCTGSQYCTLCGHISLFSEHDG